MSVQSVDPRTGEAFGPVLTETSAAELDAVVTRRGGGDRAVGRGSGGDAGRPRCGRRRTRWTPRRVSWCRWPMRRPGWGCRGWRGSWPGRRSSCGCSPTWWPPGEHRGVVVDPAVDGPPPVGHPGAAPDAGAAGPGGGVRGEQLPVRVQRAGRGHRLGAGGGLPGGGQGAPGAPADLGGGRGDPQPGAGRGGRAGGHVRDGARPRRGPGAGDPSGDPGGGVHRLVRGRAGPVRPGDVPAGPDPVLRGAGQCQPGGGHPGGGRAGRGPGHGLRGVADPGHRTVLHEPGAAAGAGRLGADRAGGRLPRPRGRPG